MEANNDIITLLRIQIVKHASVRSQACKRHSPFVHCAPNALRHTLGERLRTVALFYRRCISFFVRLHMLAQSCGCFRGLRTLVHACAVVRRLARACARFCTLVQAEETTTSIGWRVGFELSVFYCVCPTMCSMFVFVRCSSHKKIGHQYDTLQR